MKVNTAKVIPVERIPMRLALVKIDNCDGYPHAWYGQRIGEVFTVQPELKQFNEHAYPVSVLRVTTGEFEGDYILLGHVTIIKTL